MGEWRVAKSSTRRRGNRPPGSPAEDLIRWRGNARQKETTETMKEYRQFTASQSPSTNAPAQCDRVLRGLSAEDRRALLRGQLTIVLHRLRLNLPVGEAVENLLKVAA